ncbi:unnamed protein product [Rotaria sp. Silwood2]|nr:unnamed protein product [Rotaria sp. Silwood2]
MILHHGSSKSISNGLALPDRSLKRTSSRSTTAKALNTINSIDTQRANLLKEFGSSGLVVLDLVKDVPVGSAIFIDNYFASTKLIKKLTQLGYRITCTLRSNRTEKCPISTEQEFSKKQRGYYESFITKDKTCIVVGWKDSKRVLLGSNHVGIEPKTKLKRWDKEKRCRVDLVAPQIINNYNKFMGGVDSMDMLIAFHPIPFKSKRWYSRIIWRILDVMIINSWIIRNSRLCGDDSYSSASHGKFRLFHFKSEIAKFLLTKPNLQILPTTTVSSSIDVYQSDEENEPPTKKLREARSSVTDVARYDNSNHWPLFISALNNTRFAMPVSLMMTIGDHFEEKIIKFGNEDSNEDHDHPGQSVIQNCRSYVLPLLNTQMKVRMIDASGMEDTRGLTQDDVNIQHIISYISNLLYLNAMCILLNI